ncbi:MAG: site-specific DNA-methyltransferase [Desulfovibrio sp.]|jgi:site-specific DNA-methyltransferase (adenine-specific)/adenine-specific DNA-methyltransferase|nr:site-specific DNA-methyltransferase [Desulfovibrio sp.]
MPSLDWIGKKAVIRHHREVPFRLLEPTPGLSCGEASGNLLVQGDNLDALKALLPRYAGRVKCIYIDPPYNTGNEGWSYNDNVNSPEIRKWLGEVVGKEGETLDRHDRWLCMMYPRLVLLRQFLREDGIIFVSIDDNEDASLKLLLNEIFGTVNFLATIIWQKRTSPDARLNLGAAHDFIVGYAFNINKLKQTLNKIPISIDRTHSFKNPDNDQRGLWASVDMTGQTGHATPNQFFDIISPQGKKFSPPAGRCWAYSEETVKQLLADNRVWFGKNGTSRPRLKQFLSEK